MRETTTGVIAAATAVPDFQKWDVTIAAIPDATAAMTSVCSESPSRGLLAAEPPAGTVAPFVWNGRSGCTPTA
jgi:hypothetical protein